MLGHHVKFLCVKLQVSNLYMADLVSGAHPCTLLALQHPPELSLEQNLGDVPGWVTETWVENWLIG